MESSAPNSSASPRTFAIKHQRPRTSFVGCSRITDYKLLGKLGEGTFGEVHRAESLKTGAQVALKKIIMHHEKDGFPITALREIKLLKLLSHKNVLELVDMAVEHPQRASDKRKRPIMYMATPYMDHDLSGLLDNPSVTFTEPQIKCYMLQLLEGLRYLHDNHILHRDMKAANLLINNKGILQIADFGLARHYEGSTPTPGHGAGDGKREYTGLVVTRWYRPPELLLHLKKYTTAIDVWGVGCVFGEMLVGKPILAGESDSHQLEIIWDLVGSPTPENMPLFNTLPGSEAVAPRARPGSLSTRFREYGSGAISLLKELLKLDWRSRINAADALNHPYFKMAPMPANPDDLPTFEDSHELDRRKFHDRKAALPPAPKGGTVGIGPDAHGANAGFNNADAYSNRNGVNGNRHPNVPGGHRNGDERRPAWQRERGEQIGDLEVGEEEDRMWTHTFRAIGTMVRDTGTNGLRVTVAVIVETSGGMIGTGTVGRGAAAGPR
ncbi:serine threonine-protein kinase bur-1 [Colletotrichum karsti]|uniref:Serine/threonine-protein kinase BUR1 n=1 Tax=Colletotrichum karsti TaxID=1095194 RepID=A0A9P6LPT9_9PEZI|nr:serine threonine-protein kinase bur-1 [Colletotrichum karsti]KAF9881340.1 serine threonine-protein kinase bur-1 [Colletotrichum karsti]